MCRSSRLICLLTILATLAMVRVPAEAAPGRQVRVTAAVVPPAAIARAIAPRPVQAPIVPITAGNTRNRSWRVGSGERWYRFRRAVYPYSFGYGGYNDVGVGLGLDRATDDLAPAPGEVPPNDGMDLGLGGALPLPPPPCIRPLIIKIGKGVRKQTKTQVVYGAPPACVHIY